MDTYHDSSNLFLIVPMGVGSTVACESALRSAGTLLARVRAPLPAPWPDGGPESLRSPCCGLAIYKTQNLIVPMDFKARSLTSAPDAPSIRLGKHIRDAWTEEEDGVFRYSVF
ncbi:hypothetical protein PoB_002911700 [Plakobranchus ocellatus]|uniref:Uncharacterized protein n=1 Tax=Plakobranchus ocellatus TaxID=259542 RepID=A0AAV4A6V6_9GAST|nr:hypothetical protein PoB_002911700 [Plakobranchus ocellatus]